MNKKIIIVVLVIIILAVAGYLIFIKKSPAPGTTPSISQPKQTGPVVYADPQSFAPSFLACNPSELRMPFINNSTYIITVLGVENGKCHYKLDTKDTTGASVGGIARDCSVPKEMITQDTFSHLFGNDKVPGKEKILEAQTKLENDYCKK